MTESFQAATDVLKQGGPYAILVALAFAYWQQQKYIQQLHANILQSSMANLQAMMAMKTSIDGLKETLTALLQRL